MEELEREERIHQTWGGSWESERPRPGEWGTDAPGWTEIAVVDTVTAPNVDSGDEGEGEGSGDNPIEILE